MLVKSMTAALLGTAMMTGVAFAQTPTTTTDRMNAAPATSSSSATSDMNAYQGQWRSSKLIGLDVYNDNNEKLGDISELLLDKSGNVKAVIIGVGGFLGMGERNVAISFDKLKFVNEPVAYAAGSNANTNGAPRPVGSAPVAPSTTTGSATGAPATTNTTSRGNAWYPDHATLSTSKDELKSMAEFKYSN